MSQCLRNIKENVVTKLAVLAVLLMGMGTAHADSFPTGGVDFSSMSTVAAAISSATLVRWRTGTTGQSPVSAGSLSFAYLQSGTNLAVPSRTSVKDNSANNQGYLWSDNAIQLTYVKPSNTASAIVIFTSNTPNGLSDPLNGIQLRGGLVGGAGSVNPNDPNRASVLPLIWKIVSVSDLQNASGADVKFSTSAIGSTNSLFMPSYVSGSSGGACSAEGPYGSSSRINNGFCDYSSHFFLDVTNTNPNNLWFEKYDPITQASSRVGAYNYSSVVNAFGASTTEQGAGAGTDNPVFAVLGVGGANAIQTKYGATIFVEARNF